MVLDAAFHQLFIHTGMEERIIRMNSLVSLPQMQEKDI